MYNSLALGRCDSNFKTVIFKLIIQNRSLDTSCEIALRWMPQNFTNGKDNFDLDNGLVLFEKKLLTEPMLT